MKSSIFATRLNQSLQNKNLKQIDIVRLAKENGIKLGKSHMSQYVSGKTIPRKEILKFLADVLEVDAEWLLGKEENNIIKKQKDIGNGMREFKKSTKLDNVLYDVRGPVVEEASRMEEAGMQVLKLNIGNPAPFGFRTPDEVIYDMRSQLTECEGYSNAKGLFSARKAIMQYMQNKNVPNVTIDDIYTGNGVSELINLSMLALLDSGDEVLVPSPDYPLWTACVTLAGGKAVHYVCDEEAEWNPDIDDIKKKITNRTKAIVIINPNNPTGALYPKDVLQQIVNVARENNLIIFSDEIYDRLIFNDEEHTSIAALAPDLFCVTFSGLSKSHMVAGYRVGWMVLSGNKRIAKDYIEGLNMLSNMRLCSNVPAQSIVQTSLGGYQSVKNYIKQVQNICDELVKIDGMNKEKYASNTKAYIAKLQKLEQEISTNMAELNSKNIVTFHNTFDYFAHDYGLKVVGVVENEHGKTPSAGEIATLIENIKDNNVQAIFVEPEYSLKLVDTISKETGAKVYMLNPVTSGENNKDEYINIMRENLNVLKEALG